jgi:hypothetical protein
VSALLLAAETIHKTIWYPTIIGILVVVFAVALFCGSIYVLLATNLGARLGFLVVFTALTGFMVILTTLWMTTASPLNTLKGRIPSWKVQEVVKDPAKAKTSEIRRVTKVGRKVSAIESANVKAAVDEALIQKEAIPAEGKLPADANKYARFALVTDYKELATYEVGGSKPNPLDFELTHKPLFAVVKFCTVVENFKPFGISPATNPPCKAGTASWIVLERDLGSVRVPPIVAFCASVLLFGLGLLALHWRERDEQEAQKRTAVLTPARVEVAT